MMLLDLLLLQFIQDGLLTPRPVVSLPQEPDGTVVQFRKNSRSPYRVDERDGKLTIFRSGEPLAEVKWITRPAYYNRKTSNGHRMVSIGQTGGEDCLFFCYQNYCSYFPKHEQCLFCNLVATTQTYDSVLKQKDSEEMGEVAAAAFDEGTMKHILLTGGCFNHQKEIEVVAAIMKSVREHTGLDRVPGTILPSPARTMDEIKRYHETGIQAIGFSMEIWDERMYQAICPGKSKDVSHAAFLESIQHAVKVFGPGNVYGVFVMGLEPRDTLLAGVKELTGLGANVVPFVWSPNPGSKLAGHRAPTAQWFVETNLEAAEIVANSGVPSGTENHCYRCDGNSLLHDALRLKGIE